MPLSRCATKPGSVAVSSQPTLNRGRPHLRRQQRIDANALPGPFDRQLARHLMHARFRHAVDEIAAAESGSAGDGADADDAAALPALNHPPPGLLGAEEKPGQADGDGIVPISQRQFCRFFSMKGEGSVEQNIDLAVNIIEAREKILHSGRVGDIAEADFRLLTEGAYAFGRRLQSIAIDVGDEQISAGASETDGDRLRQARCRAGNDRYFSFQAEALKQLRLPTFGTSRARIAALRQCWENTHCSAECQTDGARGRKRQC